MTSLPRNSMLLAGTEQNEQDRDFQDRDYRQDRIVVFDGGAGSPGMGAGHPRADAEGEPSGRAHGAGSPSPC